MQTANLAEACEGNPVKLSVDPDRQELHRLGPRHQTREDLHHRQDPGRRPRRPGHAPPAAVPRRGRLRWDIMNGLVDLTLTPEQTLLRNTARDLANKEIAPRAAEIDKQHRFPRELVARLGELGLMGVAIPQEWGGAGMDTVSYALALEEISRACASTGVIMSVNNSLVCDPILKLRHRGAEEEPGWSRWPRARSWAASPCPSRRPGRTRPR